MNAARRLSTGVGSPDKSCTGSGITPATIAEVGRLIEDAYTLLDYAARRHLPASPPDASGPAPGPSPRPPLVTLINDGSVDVVLLARPPTEIAGDGVLLQRLYATVSMLSELVAPATVMSIRRTSALTRIPFTGGPQPTPGRLFPWLGISGILGLLVFVGVILLLIHVDHGRRALQQLQQLQTDYQSALVDLAGFDGLLPIGDRGLLLCRARSAPVSSADELPRYREPCRRLDHTVVQIGVVRRELGHWNAVSQRLAASSPLNSIAPLLGGASPGVSADDWQTSEVRSASLMAGLTGLILPTLLGLLGACTYVYRAFDRAVRSCTLNGSEGMHAVLRMLLGAILGGLLGLIWTGGQGVRVEGVTLSLGAAAFVVGFSVEIVFRTLDAMVASLARRLSESA